MPGDIARLPVWVGVDVGGRRKGFDAVVLRGNLLGEPLREGDPAVLARWIADQRPTLVAVDSPRSPAPDGLLSRPCEREFVAARVCGIRFTPDAATMDARGDGYFGWIANGLALYGELERLGVDLIECFPTASWTRWAGPRGRRRRATWSREALGGLGLDGVPARTNQDVRDAIAAAVTARQHAEGRTQRFGDLVVPLSAEWAAG